MIKLTPLQKGQNDRSRQARSCRVQRQSEGLRRWRLQRAERARNCMQQQGFAHPPPSPPGKFTSHSPPPPLRQGYPLDSAFARAAKIAHDGDGGGGGGAQPMSKEDR
jgi:hypothetical protein